MLLASCVVCFPIRRRPPPFRRRRRAGSHLVRRPAPSAEGTRFGCGMVSRLMLGGCVVESTPHGATDSSKAPLQHFSWHLAGAGLIGLLDMSAWADRRSLRDGWPLDLARCMASGSWTVREAPEDGAPCACGASTPSQEGRVLSTHTTAGGAGSATQWCGPRQGEQDRSRSSAFRSFFGFR